MNKFKLNQTNEQSFQDDQIPEVKISSINAIYLFIQIIYTIAYLALFCTFLSVSLTNQFSVKIFLTFALWTILLIINHFIYNKIINGIRFLLQGRGKQETRIDVLEKQIQNLQKQLNKDGDEGQS